MLGLIRIGKVWLSYVRLGLGKRLGYVRFGKVTKDRIRKVRIG